METTAVDLAIAVDRLTPRSFSPVVVATLFITCGVQGAGKTTRARQLEREHRALRLTPDDWLRDRFPEQRTGVAEARSGTDSGRGPERAALAWSSVSWIPRARSSFSGSPVGTPLFLPASPTVPSAISIGRSRSFSG